jgi:HEAT repeat protein
MYKLSLSLCLALLLSCAILIPVARAADDENPSFQGRKLSEWLDLMRGQQGLAQRQLALHALGVAGSHPLVWDSHTELRRLGLRVVEVIGPASSRKVLPALIESMRNDPDESMRRLAAQTLGRLAGKSKTDTKRFADVREALVGSLRTDPAGSVRQAAAAALGRIEKDHARPAVPALMAALKDTDLETRIAAAGTLRILGPYAGEAVPPLQEVLRDKKADARLRELVADALTAIGPPDALSAIPALREVLADTTAPPEVRVAVCKTAGRLGKEAGELVPALAVVLVETGARIEVRREAGLAMIEMGPDARAALPALKKALKDEDKFVRFWAMRAVGQLGKELGTERKEVLTILFQALNDNVLEVRVAALETFGNLGPEGLGDDLQAVLERVTGATRDAQKDVRAAAENTLRKLKP